MLTVPEKHALKIARDTMKMHCIGVRVMGGPNHVDAVAGIKRLTGKRVALHEDCDCEAS